VAFISTPLFVFIAVGIIAAVPRFYHLSDPHGRVFDEVYYTKDGCLYAGYPYKQCDLAAADEQSWVHPPLGKWMIAAGIRMFGNTQFGWRVSAAFVGTLTCVLIAMLAWVLWRSALWAFVAGLLAATESLLVVQSRTALLDIFQAFWTVAAFLFLALDKHWIDRRTPLVVAEPEAPDRAPPARLPGGDGSPWLSGPIPTTAFDPPGEPAGPGTVTRFRTGLRVPSPFWRPWRVAAGLAFGFAIAVKWSALPALLGGIVLTLLWERSRRKRANVRHAFWRGVARESLPVIVCLFLLPVVVYLFSYSGRIEKSPYPPYRYFPGAGYSWVAHPSRLANLTFQMENFHHNLRAEVYSSTTKKYTPAHPYESRPWSWIPMGRPVAYYYKADDAGKPNETRREVLGIGNPAIFWVQFIAIPWLAVMWRRRRDWRAGLILLAILFQYLFWFLPDVSLQKVQFFFYATPIAPFFVLGATYMVRDLARMRLQGSYSRPFLPVAVAFVAVSVVLFIWFWPVLSATPLSVSAWKARIWFSGWI
jgi:dolichyl-phosphate-mannose--protein O-mannosyl transferase